VAIVGPRRDSRADRDSLGGTGPAEDAGVIATPIVVTATTFQPEATAMLLVDCPLCDTASPFDPEDDALDCPRCAVLLEVAPDDARILAAAA
jgi:hypothetical protein